MAARTTPARAARRPEPEPTLPEPVRQRVIALAAAALHRPARRRAARAAAPGGQVRAQPAGPARRRRRSPPSSPPTRCSASGSASRVLEEAGELGAAVLEGGRARPPPTRSRWPPWPTWPGPDGWRELVEAAARDGARRGRQRGRDRAAPRRPSTGPARAEHERAVARVEADKLRDELARLRDEAAGCARRSARWAVPCARPQARERKATELLATEKGRAARAAADHDAELRRLRARLAEAETAGRRRPAAAPRRPARSTTPGCGCCWRRSGRPPSGCAASWRWSRPDQLPADFVADALADRPGAAGRAGARALEADDPARLDQLLALPRAHLVVDGYNVTKRGFGEMSLEQQRSRLVSGLGGIAAQTGAEVTVVFDGAERVVGLPPPPRGVRVLFSRKGETADELIRRLVRAEPAGRPIVVISSDREVADGVRRHGAYPLELRHPAAPARPLLTWRSGLPCVSHGASHDRDCELSVSWPPQG